MALPQETLVDHAAWLRHGRVRRHHVPVHAEPGDIKGDRRRRLCEVMQPLGGKGVNER
jgi:hypothetical protein